MSFDALSLATAGVRALSPYQPGKPVEELERELGLRDVVKLASNESPIGPSPRALDAAQRALGGLARYPDGSGHALRRKLAERLGIAPSSITLGNGSNDVLELVVRAFATPAHEVVFSQHAFAVYPLATQAVGARGVAVPAKAYGHDLDAMLDAVSPDTRVVFIANPNNPTGTWVSRDALTRFLDRLPQSVIAVVDEAYFDYIDLDEYPDCVPWVAQRPNLVVTRTFSKAYGLAALRVGFAVSDPSVADVLNRVRQPFNVNSIALAAAAAALDDDVHLARSREVNREGLSYLDSQLQRLGLRCIPSVANFISFATPKPAETVYAALLRLGVIVRPVSGYGLPDHLRVSVGLAAENRRFVDALEQVLDSG